MWESFPEADAVYNYNKQGTPLAVGAPVTRNYGWKENEVYGQDSWRATPNLTITAGLRWAYLQAPAEKTGTQVGACILNGSNCTPYALSTYYKQSALQAASGGAANAVGDFSFDLNGRYNHRADFWTPDKLDLGPRLAIAYAPTPDGGAWKRLLGQGKTSIRAGYSLVFDHFGAATVNTFNTNGSYGLSTDLSNPPGTANVGTAPRFTGITNVPTQLLPAAPPGGFPATPSSNQFAISWGLDSAIKTPYSHLIDFSIARELNKGSSLEVSYVGRLGPPAAGTGRRGHAHQPCGWAEAAIFKPRGQLALDSRAGVPVSSVQPIPYHRAGMGRAGWRGPGDGRGTGIGDTKRVSALRGEHL